MEVFRAPRVSLIARPEFLEPEHLRVQWQGGASAGERLAEFAGRICYMSQHNPANRSTADYLENIKKQGHGSVLEHAVYVLLIEGISRSCSHELVRHRAGFGYSQLSALRGRVTRRLRARGRGVDATLCVDRGQGAPAQGGARSGAQRPSQRHRGEDRRVGERPRVAHDARAAHRRRRGARDPAHGGRVSARPAARSAGAVCRFRDLSRRRQTRRRARRVPQSVTRVDSQKNLFCLLRIAPVFLIVYSTTRFDSQTARAAFFCRRSPETTCASVSHTTKSPPTAPATPSPSGTTHPPSQRWNRLSVPSATSSDSKPINSFRRTSSSPAPISSSTWPKASTARAAKRSSPRSANT